MSVCYLDADDEITDAVARLRQVRDGAAVVVVPPGSRIATSRINFRLLAREAEGRGLSLAIVSGDAGVRALAISAGTPALGSVADAEAALGVSAASRDGGRGLVEAPVTPPTEVAPRGSRGPAEAPERSVASPASREVAAATAVSSPPAPAGPVATVLPPTRSVTAYSVAPRTSANAGETGFADGVAWDAGLPGERGRIRRRGRARGRRALGIAVRLAVLAALIGGIAYAGYLYLPTASVSITPQRQTFGPMTVTVTADPAVAVTDPAAGLIPADHVGIPLSVTNTFPATGTEVSLTRATGSVHFTSENTLFDVPIPDGTTIATKDGVEFQTTGPVTLKKASFQSGPTSADADVRAVKPGPEGNVGPDTVTQLPQAISAQLVKATNPKAVSGGRRNESKVITRDDYTAAVQTLTDALTTQLQTAAVDPATTPRGLTLYPETASLGRVTVDKSQAEVAGSRAESFDLTAEAQASALAVDDALVAEVAQEKLKAAVPKGVRLFPESIQAKVAAGHVQGTRVVYDVTVSAQTFAPIDVLKAIEQIRGRTVSEARSILAGYGTVEISVWPDFIPSIPDDVRRINLTIQDPTAQ